MRQLSIAAFLLVIGLIGIYWLVTQKLSLHTFYPDTTVQFPNLVQPRSLPSITPGPAVPKLAGFAQTPAPKATFATTGRSIPHFVQHLPPAKPITAAAPQPSPVTPMPAPSFVAVTPMPYVHTPPPLPPVTTPGGLMPAVNNKTLASPSPSASPQSR